MLRFLALVSFAIASIPQAIAETVQFDRDVRPILSDKCFFCHGPDRNHREADLRLDLEAEAMAVIVPGNAGESELVARITTTDSDSLMPPADSHKKLSPSEIDVLTRWVSQGATWTQHWSFIAPQRSPVPETTDRGANSIDAFVAARLSARGQTFSPQADREKLIRRVTFDLTGMPPTIDEIDAFLADTSHDAYEKVVDRLLDSPRYGQRMALAWLDAARYGDTSVYHADGPRDMWAWRDAIVDAYNRNMPFDEFSICQLAGDLIPDATLEQKVLAGFNRNNGTTDEGGAIAEEYRVEYAVDRVKTTSTLWLGLTMECAQCHDHKYDPISHEDYYRFYAFFNVSSDGGMQTRKGNAEPMLAIPDPDKQKQLPIATQRLADAETRMQAIAANCQDELDAWLTKQSNDESTPTTLENCVEQIPLIEGSGDSVSGVIHPASQYKILGKVQWVKSRQDWGLAFDGSNYVDLGNLGDFERSDSFSYGGWVKPNKGGGGQGALLARMDNANDYRGYDLLLGNSAISVHLIHKWPDNAIKVTSKKKLKPEKWQHVFVTYDGSSKAEGIKIYVDGEIWDWNIEQDGLSETIKTEKSLLVGSRHSASRLKGTVDDVEIYSRMLEPDEIQTLSKATPVRALLAIDRESRTEEQNDSIRLYYLVTENKEYQELQSQTDSLRKQIENLKKPLTTVMVMADMEKPRETFVLNRGAYDSPTDIKVQPGTLSVLPPMSSEAPGNRLGLAHWIFRDDHPLTARVTVNRYWQMLFGNGLVSTPEDFGAQGGFPSHPELLDWLAVDFRESGWDVKRFLKQIVLSRTYRQSSRATVDSYRSDPENRLLSRGPRFRLQGEFIRDNALFISGLLTDTFGGPGVKPYQPPGLWAEVGLGGNPKFVQDHGEKLYRRSLYTYWKRSAPPPSMQIFDAPTREKCTVRRARTNTPLQALVTLNDIQFVEASRHFAHRMMSEGGDSADDRIEYGFRLATARRPDSSESTVLLDVLDGAMSRYSGDVEAAKALLAVGESPRDETLDAVDHAAWTIVASTILNLDETLTRE